MSRYTLPWTRVARSSSLGVLQTTERYCSALGEHAVFQFSFSQLFVSVVARAFSQAPAVPLCTFLSKVPLSLCVFP